MKKKVLLVMVAIMAVWQNAFAYDFAEWVNMGMYYKILYFNITGNTVTVTYKNLNYTAASGILNIPSSVTHDGTTYIVTGIDNYAFKNCTGLTSLTIPNTVTNIGNQAFYGCTGLPSVTIPNSVTSIGSSAFFGCSGIDSLTVGSGLTNIGSNAFQGDTIKYLNYNCPADVPASVIKDSLATVVIGDSITTIGSNTFSGCTSLTHVVFNAVNCMTVGSSLTPVFNGCTNIQTFSFGNNVQIIPSYLCVNCTGLTSVTIPNSVTNIGNSAFYGCTGLMSVTIPNSVTSIGSHAFYGCTGLMSVTIPNSVTSIGNYAFSNCTGLMSVTIPNSVTSIGDGLFRNCTGLTSVTIPNSVTSIGDDAFCHTGLTSVTIPNSVTSIGDWAFSICTGLTSVTIPNSVTSIGSDAFSGCTGLTTVCFNADSCVSIGGYNVAFSGCSNITNFIIGNNVKLIPKNLCNGLTGLTSVTISQSVVSIGDSAFKNCTNLTSVVFDASNCTSSSFYAFGNCNNINNFTFGNNVKTIPPYLCYNLSGITSVAIPDSVVNIGRGAFYECTGLSSVSIGKSVSNIDKYAFYNCSNLTSIEFNADSCLTVGNYYGNEDYGDRPAFYGCNNVSNIIWGDNVKMIPAYFCYGISSLRTVTVPASVARIGENAFKNCNTLDTVIMLSSVQPTRGSNAFYNNTSTRTFYIPCGSYDAYYSYSPRREPEVDINMTVMSGVGGTAEIIRYRNADVACDSISVIRAVADYGYHFDHWNNGRTANPDTLHLVGDSIVTAFFVPNRYTLTLESSDPSLGSVSGGGEYYYGDTVTITATPIEHYHLSYWESYYQYEYYYDNPCQIVISGDEYFVAYFAIDWYTVSVQSSDIVRGSVSQSGSYFEYGQPCTVSATAYTGYTFAGWSNGVTANPYTFAVLSDVELTALFIAEGEEVYTVTVVSADPTMGTAKVNGYNAAIVLNGDSVTITATAFESYRFVRWNDNDTHAVRTVTVTADATYTAYFESTTQGIEEVDGGEIRIYAADGRIHVIYADEPSALPEIHVYDLMGREVFHATHADETPALPGGVYLVKVGTLPAKKVVVIR